MKKYALLILLSCITGLTSCVKEEDFTGLLLQNETGVAFTYEMDESPFLHLRHTDSLGIQPGSSFSIYQTRTATKDPVSLIKSIYPEFTIRLLDADSTVLRFSSSEDPVGYALNPYQDASVWELNLNYDIGPGNTDATFWDYYFVIEEKYIIRE